MTSPTQTVNLTPVITNDIPTRKKPENPTLGAFFYVFSIFNSCCSLVFGKLLFDSQPKFKPEMSLVMRSFWGLIILLMLINVNFKKIMYDSVNK